MTVTLDNVERIPAPDLETFDREYLRTGRPVVLTGLYDSAATRRLADPIACRAELADLDLPVRANVVERFLARGDTPEERSASFASFYDDLVAGRAAEEFCVEHQTPPALAERVPPPAYVEVNEPGDWVSNMFLAGPGNVAHLHYDGDQRDVVMFQVFGRKRYVTIDVAETRKLSPGPRPTVRRSSGVFLENFDPDDQLAFLDYVGAWDCVLEPGEAVLIPCGTWHYVEYVDVALSVNFRLGRNRFIRSLMESVSITSPELVALCAGLRDEDAVVPELQAVHSSIIAAATAADLRSDERAAMLDQLCLRACEELDLPIAGDPYDIGDLERRSRMADGSEVRNGALPGNVARPPAAPLTRDDRVGLTDGCHILVPVTGGGLVLARGDGLEATLPPDPNHPWTLPVVARIARQPGLTIATLADGAGTDPRSAVAFLSGLAEAGWISRVSP